MYPPFVRSTIASLYPRSGYVRTSSTPCRNQGLAATLFAAACGHSHSDYDTFQGCYDEHTNVESLPFQEAVVVCCLDHPIAGNTEPCGATAPA